MEPGDGPARSDRRADGLCGLHARGRRRFRQRPLCRQTPPDRPAGTGAHVQLPGHRRQRGRRELPERDARGLPRARRKGLRADRQRVRPRERPAERTERFAGRIPHGPRRRRCGPAGHRLHRSAARLRPRAGPLQRRQRRPRGLRVRLGDRRDRRQYVRLSGPARAFRRGGGLLVLLGVGPGRGAGRGVARSLSGRRPDPGQAAHHAAGPRCVRGGLPDLSAGVAGRPAALSGRRRRAFCALRRTAASGASSSTGAAP